MRGRGSEEADGGVGGRVKLANDVTYKRYVYCLGTIRTEYGKGLIGGDRMNWTMERLEKTTENEYTVLTRVLFGLGTPTPVSPEEAKVEFLDQTLNDSQKDAVRFALASREVALIHGPPGVRLHNQVEENKSL